jgi:hypothetical protein
MPSRNYQFWAHDNSQTIRPQSFMEKNFFDESFGAGLGSGSDEWKWNDWTIDINNHNNNSPPEPLSASTMSWPETWVDPSYDVDDTRMNTEDAPYDFEETPILPQVSPAKQELRRSSARFSTLSEAEERRLRAIAMPSSTTHEIEMSPASSPLSTSSPPASRSSRPTRKRKSLSMISEDLDPDHDDEDEPKSLSQSRKRGHNAIEKRYRTNLNDKIACLGAGVPFLARKPSSDDDDSDSRESADRAEKQKHGKAAILTRALQYIKYLESTTQKLGAETDGLRMRVEAFETLAANGSMESPKIGSNHALSKKSETLEQIQSGMYS